MCTEVGVQVGGAVEGLLTDGAHEGFDGGVRESMTRQVPRLTERSPAHLTAKRLLSSVNALTTTISSRHCIYKNACLYRHMCLEIL